MSDGGPCSHLVRPSTITFLAWSLHRQNDGLLSDRDCILDGVAITHFHALCLGCDARIVSPKILGRRVVGGTATRGALCAPNVFSWQSHVSPSLQKLTADCAASQLADIGITSSDLLAQLSDPCFHAQDECPVDERPSPTVADNQLVDTLSLNVPCVTSEDECTLEAAAGMLVGDDSSMDRRALSPTEALTQHHCWWEDGCMSFS